MISNLATFRSVLGGTVLETWGAEGQLFDPGFKKAVGSKMRLHHI